MRYLILLMVGFIAGASTVQYTRPKLTLFCGPDIINDPITAHAAIHYNQTGFAVVENYTDRNTFFKNWSENTLKTYTYDGCSAFMYR